MTAVGLPRDPRDDGPHSEAGDDHPAPVEPIGDETSDRAQARIDPHEDAHDLPEMLIGGDAGEIAHDGYLHRREQLAVEVIEQRDGPE
jgi:hypothetical protein